MAESHVAAVAGLCERWRVDCVVSGNSMQSPRGACPSRPRLVRCPGARSQQEEPAK